MGQLQDVIDSVQAATGPLYRLEVFTNKLGVVINAMTLQDGTTTFESMVQVMTQRGPAQINFVITTANSPDEALTLWHVYAKEAIEKAAAEMKENESRIVVPGVMPDLPGRAPFTRKPAAN